MRTQYRCHPAISAVANDLFYGGVLANGVSEADRAPLLAWLPTLCFYSVRGLEQVGGDRQHRAVSRFNVVAVRVTSLVFRRLPGKCDL